MSDDNDVRTLLRDSDIPATRLDVGALMADSRRSYRRRRTGRAAAAVLAVVAVAVPAAVVANRWTAPEPTAGDIATATRVVHRTTVAGGTRECAMTPLPAPMAGAYSVQAVDDTGERVAAVNYSFQPLTLWTRGVPTLFSWPDLRAQRARAVGVTTSGTVVGYDPGDPGDPGGTAVSYLYRDGAVHTLAKPDGYRQALVVDVNERGDALGTLGSPDDRAALVVWPAGRPDRPRVIAEAGLTPVAIRDDGTVIALRTGERRSPVDRGDAVVVHRPDGTRLRIDAPPGFTLPGSLEYGSVHGDLLFTTLATDQRVEFGSDTGEPTGYPASRPVLWNLRTGLVEVFDDLFVERGSRVAGSGGWFTAKKEPAMVADLAVAPDGTTHRLPELARIDWISADGSTLVGDYEGAAVTWRCPG
jgi:hypothetical protein